MSERSLIRAETTSASPGRMYRLFALAGLLAVMAVVAVAMRNGEEDGAAASVPRGDRLEVRLPRPKTRDGLSVAEALARRRSCRAFADRSLSREQVAQ